MEKLKETTIYALGPAGSFSDEVAKQRAIVLSGQGIQTKVALVPKIDTVGGNALKNESCEAVLPIETGATGFVGETVALLRKGSLQIIGENPFKVEFSAYRQPGGVIKYIASKKQGFGQCSSYIEDIRKRYPDCELMELESTSKAVEKAALDLSIVALASPKAAAALGYNEIFEVNHRIQNSQFNFTRFINVRKTGEVVIPTSNCKTTFFASINDQAGSLYQFLDEFADNGIDLTQLNSLETQGGSAEFLISAAGGSEYITSVLSRLSRRRLVTKALGYYPEASLESPKTAEGLDVAGIAEKILSEMVKTNNDPGNTMDLVLFAPNRIGGLRDAIKPWAYRGIDLRRLSSWPTGYLGVYGFGVTFQNHVKDWKSLEKELTKICGQIYY